MIKSYVLVASALLFGAMGMSAKNTATDSLVNNYMRSSLYTIILTSDAQNSFYEEETANGEGASELMSIAKGFANTDAKKAANDNHSGSIFALPAQVFADIPIPNQFNDHNLQWRVVNFDSIQSGITDADLEKYPQMRKRKGAGLANLAKGAAGMNTKGNELNDMFDKYSNAVTNKFFNTNHVPELIVAKWFAYDPSKEQSWDLSVVEDRGNYNFTPDELKRAATDAEVQRKIADTGFNMISNTYVMAVNLRFRSYQAIVAEASAMAQGLGLGNMGKLASAAASAAAGDGYTVQAVSDLYRLKWNPDIADKFATQIMEKNATLDDLIKAGICELEYVGSEKSSSNIRQSLFSDKPISQLVERATARAIDEAIIKLQNGHEEFRTVFPILGGDGEVIYAPIGTKESLNEKDEYEILEAREDKDGKTTYKSVGTVKAVKGKIWNNAYGAEEEVNENSKATDEDRAALNYGYSQFKGKKGDYSGYFLRLKKKK